MKATDGPIRLSASDLAGHLACAHRTFLDREAAHRRLERPDWHDPRLETLRARGEEHERAYLAHLRASGASVVELDGSRQNGLEATRAAMREGQRAIYQPTLARGRWLGRADVLLRVERASSLGAWSYEVVDAKLARETRAGTILQLCLYSDLLADLQGVHPEWMYVVRPGVAYQAEPHRFEDYAAYYRLVRAGLRAFVDEVDGAPYPEPVPHCAVCAWSSRCRARRRADDHLSLVAGISRMHRAELESRGIGTLSALAELSMPLVPRPSRGAPESYERVREQARVQLQARRESRAVFELLPREPGRGLARLPEPSPGDFFFDFEGDRFVDDGGLEYLFGYVLMDEGEPRYRTLWALDREQERKAFEEFIDFVVARRERYPGLHIYHYAAYEPSALKRLMGRYGTRQDEVDQLLRAQVFVDLYRVVREGVLAGIESYSIKELERFYGLIRETPLDDASRHLQAFETALERGEVLPDESRDAVASYNRDDCLSTLALRDWLESLRVELHSSGEALARPAPTDGAVPDQLGESQKRTRELADRLLAGIPADRNERTPEQQARFLTANLLEFHRREESAAAWEYFRLLDLSEEELLFERGAIAGLACVERIEDEGGKAVDRYEFPSQETALRAGQKLRSSDGASFGTVEAMDTTRRSITVRKLKKTRDLHPSAVFAYERITHGAQKDALYRLGARIAERGFDDGPESDLLLRRPPRSLDPAARACGVLPVQGPPGSGKTYRGARMVVDLVRAGKRVGVTALSHQVIRNLLDEVVKAAEEQGVRARCLRKVREPTDDGGPIVEVDDNDAVREALEAGEVDVVGGTAWLWSREELTDSVDVLFVDEAGQLSLADVLAVSQSARGLVLLGDPQQLDQPQQASHPEGTEVSALEHVLGGALTIADDRGVFLPVTRRLHPAICAFTSELFYEGRLSSFDGLERQSIVGHARVSGAGLWFSPVEHEGNQNASPEEVERVSALVQSLVARDVRFRGASGEERPFQLSDILVVAPYNAQVSDLVERLPAGARVGTVDKFQGQEAPVVIYSLTTSSPDEAPRGMEFLYSLHRLNVATSRAQAACILVGSPRVLEPACHSPRQMRLANALCRYAEMARELGPGDLESA